MNSTSKFITAVFALLLLLASMPAIAQKGGDTLFAPHDQECLSPSWAIVANGYRNTDVSTANRLASNGGRLADVVSVNKHSIPEISMEMLKTKFGRGGPTAVLYVVGGEKAVSDDVVEQVQKEVGAKKVRRLGKEGTRHYTINAANFVEDTCK